VGFVVFANGINLAAAQHVYRVTQHKEARIKAGLLFHISKN
jgi:hypothetical protein